MKKSRSYCRSRAGGGRDPRLGVPRAQPFVRRVWRAVRRVPGRVLIQAHHTMPWLAPLFLSTEQGHGPMKPRRRAALGKQIPRLAVRQRGPNGRRQRDGVALSMNPSCLRVVSQRVALARQTGGRSTARPDCVLSCPRLAVRCPPGSDDPRAGGRGRALPSAGRGRHHPGRDRLAALHRHGRRAGGRQHASRHVSACGEGRTWCPCA